MNSDYLQSLWTFVATAAVYFSTAAEILWPDFDTMSPDNVNRAIVVYDEQLKADPEAANVYLRRGAARIKTTEFDKALADFDAVIRLDPNSSNAYVLRASVRKERKQFDLALSDCDEAIRLHPKQQLAFFHRGTIWAAKQQWDEAIRDFDEAIRLSPNHAATYGSRGRARQAKAEYALAVADLSRAIRLAPNDAAMYVSRGMTWASRHRLNAAIADFTEAIRLDPNNAESYRLRSQVFFSQDETDKAIADLTEAIRLEPDNALSYSNRGWLWHTQDEFDQAIADLKDAIKLDPSDPRTYLRRANVLVSHGDLGRALLDAQTADELDSRLVSNRRMEDLVKYVWRVTNQKLLDRNDDNRDDAKFASACRDRGIALSALEDLENALDDLSEAIRLEPSSSIAYAVRGQIWVKKQEWDSAIDDFDAALRLNPDDTRTWNARGTAQAERQEWTKAIADFSEAIRLDPKCIRAFAQRASAWQAQQEWDLAIADYDQVTRGDPFFAHAPRRRWQDEKQETLNDSPAEPDGSAADSTTESEFISAIRKITGSKDKDDDFSHLFDRTGDKPDEIFVDRNSASTTKPQRNGGSKASSQMKHLTSADGASAANRICISPVYVTAFQKRAECRKAKHEWTKAAKDYAELIRLTPSDPQAYRRLAWLKATCPDDDCRSGTEAVRYASQAVERTRVADPDNLVVLAAAYAESGDFEYAVEYQVQARELSTESWDRAWLARRKHFEALEFQKTFEKSGSQPRAETAIVVKAAIEACEQSEWMVPQRIESLADAYAAAGQFAQAIATQEKAHALNVAKFDKPLVEVLELYHAGKPCRDVQTGNYSTSRNVP